MDGVYLVCPVSVLLDESHLSTKATAKASSVNSKRNIINPPLYDDNDVDSTFPILSNWSPVLSSLGVPANYDTCQSTTPVPVVANSTIRQCDWTRSYCRSGYIDSISSPHSNLDIPTGAMVPGIVWDSDSLSTFSASSIEFESDWSQYPLSSTSPRQTVNVNNKTKASRWMLKWVYQVSDKDCYGCTASSVSLLRNFPSPIPPPFLSPLQAPSTHPSPPSPHPPDPYHLSTTQLLTSLSSLFTPQLIFNPSSPPLDLPSTSSNAPLSQFISGRLSASEQKHLGRRDSFILSSSSTEFHPPSSCAFLLLSLGGVVDPSTSRVYGIANVRVMDAGFFPIEMGAHIGTPTDGSGVNLTDNSSSSSGSGSGSAGSGRDVGGGVMAIMGGLKSRRDDGRVGLGFVLANPIIFFRL
ncbi:hypothetical protein K435DRAFT_871826 [Dendrothele bispora CBS 962.96]|uniref:Glucose-methanol-choline oxidoreductase C-terminal domain-containing protein n=1 Tax=Dendrothele bispora (strain CBS 962.96) TaxID=1314807 RepID=A0A4S8L368_DENBC|nr:hypothetical protein K435DRAFT_871826 [Dendrothele bispora CBS 962.96]